MLEAFREAQKLGGDDLKQFVTKRFRGTGWRTDDALASTDEADDFYVSEWCQVKPPSLYKGRFVMVGDAGYAPEPSGAGTSLAIGGAYILAGEINDHKGDLAAGLAAYEARRRPIVKDMQVVPPGILTVMAPQTAWLYPSATRSSR